MMNFKGMSKDEKNLFGLCDIVSSTSEFTGLSVKDILQRVVEVKKLSVYFNIGWFIACGNRDIKVYGFCMA